jgi:putative colanic acid biosynthesis glycosyltransferase
MHDAFSPRLGTHWRDCSVDYRGQYANSTQLDAMNPPTLTIVTVNYNNRSGLIKTIHSVAAQTYQYIQTVVIDGQSTDGSVEFLRTVKLPHCHITSEKDRGIYHAMQKGLSQVEGDAVIFLNSGDVFYQDSTVEEIARLMDLRYAIVLGRTAQRFRGDVYLRPRLSQLGSLLTFPAHQGVIVPSAIAKGVPFSEEYCITADHRWILECLRRANYVISPMIISCFELGGVSNSARAGDLLRWITEETGSARLIRAGKACIKFVVRNVMGQRWYYRLLLSFRCEYVRQPESEAPAKSPSG